VHGWRRTSWRGVFRRLSSSETFKTGVLNLRYGPAESTGDATYEYAKVHLASQSSTATRSAEAEQWWEDDHDGGGPQGEDG
jgi:hypothetical protein